MRIYTGYSPHEGQARFHSSRAKFRGLITGVGFGKSAAGANEMIKIALQYPKSLHLIISPTSKMMNYATLAQFWKFCPKEIIQDHVKSQNIIKLKGGSRIIYLTADNERHIDRLRGMEVGSFWMDEPRLIPGYIWEILMTRLRDSHGPLRGWNTTTPHGFDWNYSYFVKKEHPVTRKPIHDPEKYEYFTGTSLDNPHTPQEFKNNLLSQLAGKFKRQEIYGEFVGFQGQVYDNFRPDIHMITDTSKLTFKNFVFGLDMGFTNPTACSLMGFDSDDRAYVLEEFYEKRVNEEILSRWIYNIKKKYNTDAMIYADPSNPAYIDKLASMGHQICPADNSVMDGINRVYSRFEVQKDGKPRLFIASRCKNTIDEINSYRYVEKEGKEQKEEPLKINDHLMDSMRYSIYSYDSGFGSFTVLDSEGLL